jgi:hypothetical protein
MQHASNDRLGSVALHTAVPQDNDLQLSAWLVMLNVMRHSQLSVGGQCSSQFHSLWLHMD